jgi:Cu/Ag efflux protein CusF
MALGIAALALSFTEPVRAQDTSTNAPPPKMKRHQFTGEVTAIDAKAGTVIVKKAGADSKTFKIGEKTKYSTADKKDAALADIKVGDKVTVSYTEDEGGVLTAHKIGPPASAK